MEGRAGGRDLSPRCFLILLMVMLGCLYLSLARDSYLSDFHAYYIAATAAHDGLDPYVNHVNESERYADAFWLNRGSRFVYPPTALIFFYPFQALPYHRAKLLQAVLILLAFIALFDLFHREYPEQTLVLLMLFCSVPVFAHVDLGQVDVFVLLLLLGAFLLRDGWSAGACLGLAVAIKLAPVLAVMWFVANRRWRTVAWSFVVGLSTAAMAWLKLGTALYLEFFRHLMEMMRPGCITLWSTA
jgi:hypothetical protein